MLGSWRKDTRYVVQPVNWSDGQILQQGQTLNSDIPGKFLSQLSPSSGRRSGAAVLPADASLNMATGANTLGGGSAAGPWR